tara:strand:- start:2132 stop:2737 length:606 start_codon:yes stop_codon:yes gene_type:complete
MVEIDYYFHCASPLTYLGHARICDLAERHKATLRYKPVNPGDNRDTGGAQSGPHPAALPIPPDLQRLAAARGLSLHPAPKHRPVNSGLADRVVIALVEAGHDPRYFVGKVLSGAWAQDDGVADPAMLASYLSQVGLDAAPALIDAKTEEVAAIRERNSHEAIAAGAVAVPAYVFHGEAFVGPDRIDLLEEALRTGRRAFPH